MKIYQLIIIENNEVFSEIYLNLEEATERMRQLYHDIVIESTDTESIEKADINLEKGTASLLLKDGQEIRWSVIEFQVTEKWKVIYDEETENPGFAGFHHIILSNGNNFLFGYYDMHDGDFGLCDNMESLLRGELNKYQQSKFGTNINEVISNICLKLDTFEHLGTTKDPLKIL